MTNEQIIEAEKEMTVLELNDLVKAIEEEFGVTAAAPVAAGGAVGGAAEEEEQTEFDVVLEDAGGYKSKVVKAVSEIRELGIKDAKDMKEAPPKAIKEGVTIEEAEDMKEKLEAAGAKVTIK